MDNTVDKNVGQEIGNYRVLEKISSGSFGTVYKGEHIVFAGEIVAIKVLHAHHDSPEDRERFLREARLLKKLKHSHILPVIDAGFNKDRFPYIVSDYAPQGSLRDRLKRHGKRPLPLEEALGILKQVGEGLTYAHKQNIVHRDLKPDNILFNAQGEALLADFGIATALPTTSTTSVLFPTGIMGTPLYMAPEQFQHNVSRRSDQYAFGCIAYELLTGRLPFVANDIYTLLSKHIAEQPPDPAQFNPHLPDHMIQALLRSLEKKRENRYPDIASFLQALCTPPIPAKSQEQWMEEALFHQERAQYAQSLEACEQALRANPALASAYGGKALALYSLGRYREALETIELALDLAPQNATFYFGKGLILESLQRYQEALGFYLRATRLEPAYVLARQKGEALLQRIQTTNQTNS